MATTKTVHAPRKSRCYNNLRDRGRKAKRAMELLRAGKSLREAAAETGLPKSTLSDMRKTSSDKEEFVSVSQKRKIQISVLNYCHRELLKKPKKYRRRAKGGKKTNWEIVSYADVKDYLEKHWQTAHENGQPGLKSESWIPSARSYYYLCQTIPSYSDDRRRQKVSNHGSD